MQERQRKVPVLIPLNLDGYLFSGKWKNGKGTQVLQRLAADFTGWEKDNQTFQPGCSQPQKIPPRGLAPSDSPAQPSPQFVKAKREKHQVIPPASRNPRLRTCPTGWLKTRHDERAYLR